MKDDQKQESDEDMDEMIRELAELLDNMGEDLDMLAAVMVYLYATEQ